MEPKELSRRVQSENGPLERRLFDAAAANFDVPISSNRTIDYREYTITYHRTLAGWIARFRETGSYTFVASYFVTAMLDEGEAVLLVRTRAKIDTVCSEAVR
jgi:hypothetical protein